MIVYKWHIYTYFIKHLLFFVFALASNYSCRSRGGVRCSGAQRLRDLIKLCLLSVQLFFQHFLARNKLLQILLIFFFDA